MSEQASQTKSRHPPGITGHPALSRKMTRKPRLPQMSESSVVGIKPLTSDTSSVITTSTNARHLQVNTRFENTYKMLPDEDKRFIKATSAVQGAVQSILESYLCDVDYEQEKCSTLSKDLAQLIKQRLRDMNFERYKLLVTLMIGENTGQALQTSARFLWNTNTDNYLTVNYQNGSLFAVATVYAVYYE